MNIGQKIGQIGENPNFIAFMAHSGVAYSVVHTVHWRWTWAVAIALAAVKELWFDLRYEAYPPQTVEDSLFDLAGYLAGIGLACALR